MIAYDWRANEKAQTRTHVGAQATWRCAHMGSILQYFIATISWPRWRPNENQLLCSRYITRGLPALCASCKISLMLSQPPTLERIRRTPLSTQCKEKCTLEERFAKCNERHVPRERTRIMSTRVSPRHAQRHSKNCTCSATQHDHNCTCLLQALSTHIPLAYRTLYLCLAFDLHSGLSMPEPSRKLTASNRAPSPFDQGHGET